jgi:predicted HTH domain antitoxin
MGQRTLTIAYPDDLPVALKMTPEEFAAEARLLLAVKLFELGRISTRRAAELADSPLAVFLEALHRFRVSPFTDDPDELDRDIATAVGGAAGRRSTDTPLHRGC